jgi:hypothetical protein
MFASLGKEVELFFFVVVWHRPHLLVAKYTLKNVATDIAEPQNPTTGPTSLQKSWTCFQPREIFGCLTENGFFFGFTATLSGGNVGSSVSSEG